MPVTVDFIAAFSELEKKFSDLQKQISEGQNELYRIQGEYRLLKKLQAEEQNDVLPPPKND